MELFCIKHGKMYHAEDGVCGLGHVSIIMGQDEVGAWHDLDFCCFPPYGEGWATCPPPEAPDMDLIACFDRPYMEDLLEHHARTEQEMAELFFDLLVK